MLNTLSLWTITVDDSYISLRYARSFLSGEGLTYNPGERVEGFSNPTWVALMALTLPVSASLMGSKVLGIFSLIATILGCVGLAAELTPPKTRVQELALISGAGFLAVSLPAVFWPVTGMETSFYAAMIVLTAWRLLVEIREPQRSPLSAVLAGLTAITRPEAPLVVGGLFLGRLAAGREDWRSTARWLGIFAVPTVGYLCFRLLYFGYPLANTYYQKGHADSFSALLDYVRPWLTNEAPLAVLGVVGVAVLGFRLRARSWPVLLAMAGHVFFLVYVSRDWMPNQRFIVPLLPFLVVGVCSVSSMLAGRLVGRMAWLPMVAVLSLIGLQASKTLPVQRAGMSGNAVEVTQRDPWMRLPDALNHTWKGHAKVPIWLMERAAPGASVAYTDIGMTGWVTDLTIIDLAGLTDAVTSGATGLEWPERAAYVGERAPDWIVLKQAGSIRFETISSSPWLVEHYELQEGPNNTLAGRRWDAPLATDAEVLASFEQAVAREPRSLRFLWRRAVWTAIAGTPEQLTVACDDLAGFADSRERLEQCQAFFDKPPRRPSIEPQPLPEALSRHLKSPSPQAARKASSQSAPATPAAPAIARVSLDAPRPSPSSSNPFSRAGDRGVGSGWVVYPKSVGGQIASRDDGALKMLAHPGEDVHACDAKHAVSGSTVQVTGAWRLEGITGGELELFLAVFDGDGKRMKPSRMVKFWPVVSLDGDQGWSTFSAERTLPEGATEVRLCLSLPAATGTAWLQDLQVATP
ncbi:MAG: hypothetical protein P8R54_07950 [Myxococcota bacterium]|nr:hypothetical protein [Myxococcota bacterium]